MLNKFSNEQYTEKLLQIADEYEKKLYEFTKDTDGKDFLQTILKGHLYIEQELNLLLGKYLKHPEHLDNRMNFSSKLNLVFALGVIESPEKVVIQRINELRNKYAHQVNFEIDQEYFDDRIVAAFSQGTKKSYLQFLSSHKEKDQLIIQLGFALYTVWHMLLEKALIPDDIREQLNREIKRHS
ncbi:MULTISPECIES: hypothetical protein [Brevibacillus]|uniref:hypothetical protein n=1 Tax=Brevibacillus TaxID=55080 RepID=UPI00362C5468